MKYIHFFFCLLLGMAVQAQIKIGDNPQNIDPSSVLELESSSRVLVITRVNTAQMNAITPSAGAMVYNTDIECIHYYTGAEWKDICDAVAGSITFTSDDGTVVITSTGGNNYDLKVGEITGMNIVNETVFGADIATATIGERQLAPNSVGTSELQDNTVGKTEIQEAAVGTLEIIDGSIKPEDVEPGAFDQLLTTDAGGNVVWLNKNELGATQADQTTITGAGTATDPIKVADTVIGDILANANSITVNANNIAQNSTNIATNVATLLTKEDLSNKSDDTALGNSTTLYPTQNAVKTYVDLVSGAASTLNDGNIFVGNAANVATGVAMGGDATIDNTGAVTIADLAISSPKIALNAVGEPQLANNSVTSGIIRDGEVRTGDILNGNVTDAKLDKANIPLSGFGPAAADVSLGNNRIINLDDPQDPQDAATRAFVLTQVGAVSGTGDITSSDLTITGGTNAAFTDVGLEITAGAVGTAELADDSVSSAKIDDGAILAEDLNDMGAADGQVLKWNNTTLTWEPAADENTGTPTLNNANIFIGDAANSPQPQTISGDATLDNAGILTIEDDAVTSAKIDDGAILAEDLNNMGATDGQVLKWNNATLTWEPAADDNTGTPVLTNANIFIGDATNAAQPQTVSGDATLDNTGVLTIENDAVTSSKIENGTILAEDLNQMGAADGQILKWDITANGGLGGWILAEDRTDGTGIPSLTDGTFLIGDGANLPQERTINGDATIDNFGVLTIENDAVTSAKIANAAILAEDLNQMGAANDQVLKWNGTNWAPAADAEGSTITPGIGLTLNGTDFDVDDLAGEVTGPTSATVIA
ncbi:hypothetical protein C7972_10886, partial [Arenibacter sp. ARW7G5Y1]